MTAPLAPGVIAPQALLGLSFAALVAPLTTSVMSKRKGFLWGAEIGFDGKGWFL